MGGFVSRSLAASQGATPYERRSSRDDVYAVIRARTQSQCRGTGSSGCARWPGGEPGQVLPALAGLEA